MGNGIVALKFISFGQKKVSLALHFSSSIVNDGPQNEITPIYAGPVFARNMLLAKLQRFGGAYAFYADICLRSKFDEL